MSLSVPFPGRAARPLLALCALAVGLVVLLPLPAGALERRAFGDVVVGPGERHEEVSTAFGDITVDGSVEEDVHSGFGDVEVNGDVGGDVEAGRGDIEINAPVDDDVEAGLGDVRIDSQIGGDVDVEHGDVYLGPGALIDGNLYYGNGTLHGNPDAVKGDIKVGMAADFGDAEGSRLLGFVGWFFAALVFVACSVLAVVLAPRPLLAAARRAEESPWRSLLLGVLSVPAAVILSLVLGISIVGIPVLLLLAPAYLALVFFGAIVAAYFVGRRVVLATGRYRGGNVLAAVVGALLVSATYLIPLLGDLLLYLLALLGTGAAILALFGRRRPRAAYPSYEAYVRDRRDA
jgi:cytoskeletal protein CcmA (bactofilin family)